MGTGFKALHVTIQEIECSQQEAIGRVIAPNEYG